jgi:hypothetical protein
MVRVPVGVDEMEFDSGATVIVMTSLAPEDGAVVAADSEVVVAWSSEDELAVHEVIRL